MPQLRGVPAGAPQHDSGECGFREPQTGDALLLAPASVVDDEDVAPVRLGDHFQDRVRAAEVGHGARGSREWCTRQERPKRWWRPPHGGIQIDGRICDRGRRHPFVSGSNGAHDGVAVGWSASSRMTPATSSSRSMGQPQ